MPHPTTPPHPVPGGRAARRPKRRTALAPLMFPLRALSLSLCLAAPAAQAQAQAQAPAATAPVLAGAERLGQGPLQLWRKGGSTLLEMPAESFRRLALWYVELVGAPAGVVATQGLEVGNAVVRFERQGPVVLVRRLDTALERRGGRPADEKPVPTPERAADRAAPPTGQVEGSAAGDAKRPIERALGTLETGPVIAALPVHELRADGSVVVDVGAVLTGDVATLSARSFLVRNAGVVPAVVDPARSYLAQARSRGQGLHARAHLTYLVTQPSAAVLGPQPVSLVLGHSWVLLPQTPMAGRVTHPRLGFFSTSFTQYEADRGTATEPVSYINRFRLEKANPAVPLSDPVKPITYYIGPGVPQRWRAALRAGVLAWLPVFESAGFSNALRVLDAPTDDPDWSPEDVTVNVIRWVTEPHANAMGPHVVDPRSGETLSAHILVWPSVIDFMGRYYWALFSTVDPAAAKLPLSTDKSAAILSYIVAHEVGHTLGLLHNQIASTARSVHDLRNPAVANAHGPNSSVMAYGRFNQAAQPGDGVTQLWSVMGPYDHAAIRYGYGSFGSDAATEAQALKAFGDSLGQSRLTWFGSEEGLANVARFKFDPRVQTENVGAERVEATRLGVANLQRSLRHIDAATGGDPALYADAWAMLLDRQMALLRSVGRVLAATQPPLGAGEGPKARVLAAAEQRAAVRYLLGEGAESLTPFAAPEVVERVAVYGGARHIEALQASLVTALLDSSTLPQLEAQRRRDPMAYGPADFGRDLNAAVWGDLKTSTPTRRALQRGYVDALRPLLKAWAEGRSDQEAAELKQVVGLGLPVIAGRALVETGDDTLFQGWLRQSLPVLQRQLDAAARGQADETARLHYRDMADQLARLAGAAGR